MDNNPKARLFIPYMATNRWQCDYTVQCNQTFMWREEINGAIYAGAWQTKIALIPWVIYPEASINKQTGDEWNFTQ